MRYLLDTNVCIRHLNGTSEAIKRELLVRGREDIVMCSVVKAELCYGAFKSKNPERNLERLRSFVEGFISLPLDGQCCWSLWTDSGGSGENWEACRSE